MENYPIRQFDVELMLNLLLRKKLGLHEADYSGFSNEITWGNRRPGAIKLEVDTGYTFYIKRLNSFIHIYVLFFTNYLLR